MTDPESDDLHNPKRLLTFRLPEALRGDLVDITVIDNSDLDAEVNRAGQKYVIARVTAPIFAEERAMAKLLAEDASRHRNDED